MTRRPIRDPAVDEEDRGTCGFGILVDAVTMPVLPAASLGWRFEARMGDDVAALLLTLAAENAELRQQLAAVQDMLVETAIDAGQLHARMKVVEAECDAWRAEAQRFKLPMALAS